MTHQTKSRMVFLAIVLLLIGTISHNSFAQSKKKSSLKQCTSNHTVLMDLEDGFWNPFTTPCGELDPDGVCTGCAALDLSFEATLQITTIGDQVYIQIPAMNFTIPETQNECYTNSASYSPPPGGYVYLKNGFLPNKIRPNSVLPLTFTIQSSEYPPIQDPAVTTQGFNYELQIDTEGRIKIAGQGFNPLPVGRHSLLPTTISYIARKDCLKAPLNVPVSLTASIPNNSNYSAQFLELQMSSFENGKVAFTFGDNDAPNQPHLTKCKVAIADVQMNEAGPRFDFNVPQLTFDPSTQLPPFQYGTEWFSGIESDVAINPTNTNNIVWTGITRINNDAEGGLGAPWPTSRFPIVTQYTTDGGFTWSAPLRIDFDNNSRLRTDIRLRTDPFGNFWAIYGNMGPLYNAETDSGVSITIVVSSDGGATWNTAAQILPPDPADFFDYPMLHWGGDGNGGIAMYFSWMNITFDSNNNFVYKNYLAALPVTGLGQYDATQLQVINDFPQIDGLVAFGEIVATPNGTVIYGSSDSAAYAGFGVPQNGLEAHSHIIIHEGGLTNFTPSGFSEPRLVDYTTIGQTFNGQHNVVWQTPRGVLPSVGTQGLAYDPNSGRLYALSQTELNPQTVNDPSQASLFYNQGVLNLRWSYDFGQTWSQPIPIRDSKIGQVGICTINVDPTTGYIACGWYDPRQDPKNQQEIKWFATVLAPPADKANTSTPKFALKKPNIKKNGEKQTQIKGRVALP